MCRILDTFAAKHGLINPTPALIRKTHILFSGKSRSNIQKYFAALIFDLVLMCSFSDAEAQTSIPSGSFIINMGVLPQTVANGLRPYGMVYDIVKNYHGAVIWSINPGKAKDGIDFSYGGTDYKGGTFIISKDYRTPEINTRITYWQGQGVVGVTTTSPVTVPVYATLDNMPNWTLDYQNGSIAVNFFVNAMIPATAYGGSDKSGWKTPAQLGYCDDLFVMPHADPTWATHANLLAWNLTYKGGIWLGCHAGSALEDMFNPADKTQQTNFLSNKTGIATGTASYCQNALQLWSNHSAGSPPYSYSYPEDPIMQFMGTMDAAQQNGSEQMYMPVLSGSWRAGAKLYVTDPTQADVPSKSPGPAATLISGRGFDDPNRGRVMMQAGHNISGTAAANVAAQRAFFNFSFYATEEKAQAAALSINTIPSPLYAGVAQPLSFTFSGIVSNYDILWQSSGGGTFTPNATSQSVTFTPPAVTSPTTCIISLTLTDKICPLKVVSSSPSIQIACGLQVATTVSPSCYGSSSGSITMSISGGPAPYVWSWTRSEGGTGSGTGTTLSGLAPGTYNVTVNASGGTGCGKSFTVTVSQNPQINISSSSTNILCNGGSSGSINLTVSGGSPAYTYLWTGGAISQNRTGLAAGSYNVTVTDSKGCTQASSAITLTQPAALVITPTVTNLTCNGNPTGAVSLSIGGGTGPFTYAWTDGPATQNRTALAAGTYAVTVTDANGCRQTLSGISVTQPAALSVSASAGTIACNGGTTTLTATASGGTGTLQYSLNGGTYQTSNTFTVAASASEYVVTVKDANNCTKTASVLVSQLGAMVLSTAVTPVTCPANSGAISTTVTGGTSPYTYKIGDGSYGASGNFTGLTAGSYIVTVKDANACTSTITAVVNTTSALTVTATGANPICNGASTGSINLAVSGGTPAYTYLWTGGATTQNLSGLAAGTYTVTVTDSKGCTATASSTLAQPGAITITPSVTAVTCNGTATGAIAVAVSGGTSPYTYSWTDGPATQNRTGLVAGTYAVTVTDSKNCTQTLTGISVTQPTAITASASAGTILCNGGTTTLTVTASGGYGTLQYSLNGGTYQSGNTFTVSASSSDYVITVKDANSCTKTCSVAVTQPSAMALTTAITAVTCPANSGAINLTVTGGTAPYTYNIDGGSFGASGNFTGLTAGSHTLIARDNNACTSTISATVNTIASLSATATGANPICNGVSTGSINLTVSGGTPGYTYLWTGGATTQNLSGLAAGTYSVTVTDTKGCTATATSTLTQPAAMVITPIVTNVACNGNSTGAIAISVSGGSSPYTYAWGDGPATQNRTGLVAGTYAVTVTDSKNCTQTLSGISVTQPTAISASAAAGTISCNGVTTTLTVTASGGNGTLQYSLNGGTYQTANTFTVSASASDYIVTVKDANNCTKTTNGVSVTQPGAILLATDITSVTCPANSGAINLTATGGTGPFEYQIGTAGYVGSGNFSDLTAGTYTVTAKDGNGCTSEKSVTVSTTSALTASASGTNPICNTGSTGSINLTISGGTPGYTYLWTGGATTQNLSGVAAGTYSVTVTDTNGCSATSSATLTAPAAIVITPSVTNIVCNGNSTGAISLAVTNGSSPYTYAWTDGPTAQNRTGLAAGTYTVTVTDSKKCTQTSTNTVTQATAISATASAGTISCNGGTTTLTVTASGGTGTLQYSLNGGSYQSLNTFTVYASASDYVVTVKDENNCTKTTNSVTVTQPAAISLSSVITPYSCSGSKGAINLTATGGTGSFTYKIGTGDYGASGDFTGLNAGDYTVTAKDGSGCISSKTVTVSSTTTLSASATGSHPLCNTGSTGSINLAVSGGTPAYTYAWTGGLTTQNLSGLAAGTYSVTVTDTKGCEATASATLTAPAAMIINPTVTNVACNGYATGAISLSITNGASPYTYAWSDGPAVNPRTGLVAGTYTVTVTDSKSCTQTLGGISVTEGTITATAAAGTILCNGASTTLTVTAGGGTAPLQYSLNGGTYQSSNTFTVYASAVEYIVTVKDANNCTKATNGVLVTQPTAITPTTVISHESCPGKNDASINLSVTGGTPGSGYTYDWSNDGYEDPDNDTEDLSGLTAGTYTVIVTDSKGCTATLANTVRTLNANPSKPGGIK